MLRSSGILMHISSLPGNYGIGTMGKEAYKFIDFLDRCNQKYWQVLPLGPTGFADSPYQGVSAFAGNPYFIDLDLLKEDGLLENSDYENLDFGSDKEKVDYEKIFKNKFKVLRIAFKNKDDKYKESIEIFKSENKYWIEDYGLYMALKTEFDLKSWQNWDKEIKLRNLKNLIYYKEKLKDEIEYWIFLQYLFFKQWNGLKEYANKKGIEIIGDVPIYVAEDSVDTWSNSEMFLLDESKKPIVVSGVPPDGFSEDGQLWGNPIYDWELLARNNFSWWVERIRMNLKLYDVIRIDHFRGFESYWEVKYGEKTAKEGKWVKGPNIKIFEVIKGELGDIPIILEDLGYLTKEVKDFQERLNYPGMKILQFAFDSDENNVYLPHHYDEDCVVYTGTHDNDTVNGWLDNIHKNTFNFAKRYLGLNKEEGYNWGIIRGAWSSNAKIAIAQMQDFLGLDSSSRMNTPSKVNDNWTWRIREECFTEGLTEKIRYIAKIYGRVKKR